MPKINYNIPASSYCHGGSRPLNSIKYIVLHYTAVNGDSAKNEALYFSRNYSRYAGAHFFVDQKGKIAQSISMDITAWSVGGAKYAGTNPQYYGKCTNFNSVSIEMCDQINKDAGAKQIASVKWLIDYIQKHCPNAKTIIRHWDVNGKLCPARMSGANNSEWSKFKKAITASSGSSSTFTPYRVKVIKNAGVRPKASWSAKKTMVIYVGGVYTIVGESKNKKWGKLKSGAGWVNLAYVKKV